MVFSKTEQAAVFAGVNGHICLKLYKSQHQKGLLLHSCSVKHLFKSKYFLKVKKHLGKQDRHRTFMHSPYTLSSQDGLLKNGDCQFKEAKFLSSSQLSLSHETLQQKNPIFLSLFSLLWGKQKTETKKNQGLTSSCGRFNDSPQEYGLGKSQITGGILPHPTISPGPFGDHLFLWHEQEL